MGHVDPTQTVLWKLEQGDVMITTSHGHPFAATNALRALREAESFVEKFFGHRLELSERFVMPETLPSSDVIAVYDPGNLDNVQVLERCCAVKRSLANVIVDVPLNLFTGSEAAGAPTLRFAERSERQTSLNLGILSADEVVASGGSSMSLREYIIAFFHYNALTGRYLDSKTSTIFPYNRLRRDVVALARWFCFRPCLTTEVANSGYRYTHTACRWVVDCPLVTN